MASEIFNNILKQAKERHSSLGDISDNDEQKDDNSAQKGGMDSSSNIKQASPGIKKSSSSIKEPSASSMKTSIKESSASSMKTDAQGKPEDKIRESTQDRKPDAGTADNKSASTDNTTPDSGAEATADSYNAFDRDTAAESRDHSDDSDVTATRDSAADSDPASIANNAAYLTDKGRLEEADRIIKNRMIASVGVGLIPLPVVDIAALAGIQMDTVRALCRLYDVKFKDELGKTAISSLTGGLSPVAISPWVGSLLKGIPLLGQLMGVLSMPVMAGASTYAIGKVFVQHFESGGTFLTFDPDKVKEYYRQEYNKGKILATEEAKAG
ncbi:MAG: DUF697 domain-containing protein [Desulfamplus sp.]|nr:DUF697 domain-containing protein [Desulfamplus sp.]